MSFTPTIRIAVLECDKTVPEVCEVYGPYYSSCFSSLLNDAAKKRKICPDLEFSSWDVTQGQFPDLHKIDALIVTGSIKDAFGEELWIHRLNNFIRGAYLEHTQLRMFGACFGHQIICKSLLNGHGLVVEKNPAGYGIGIQSIDLDSRFASVIADRNKINVPEQIRMQFAHRDLVIVPPGSLPPTWMPVGTNSHCQNQGLYEPGRVLTFQGHFEFDEFMMTKTTKHFYTPDRGFSADATKLAMAAARGPDDAGEAAKIVLAFLTSQDENVSS